MCIYKQRNEKERQIYGGEVKGEGDSLKGIGLCYYDERGDSKGRNLMEKFILSNCPTP